LSGEFRIPPGGGGGAAAAAAWPPALHRAGAVMLKVIFLPKTPLSFAISQRFQERDIRPTGMRKGP